MSWQAYYGDGTVVRSGDCAVENVPAVGIQVILQYDPHVGWCVQSGCDYYIYCEKDNVWQGVDFVGFIIYLQRPGWKRVLLGETIRSEVYHVIYQDALQERNRLRAG